MTRHIGLYPIIITVVSMKLYNSNSRALLMWLLLLLGCGRHLTFDILKCSSGLELTKEVLPGDNTLPKPGTLVVEYPVLRLELEIFYDTVEVVVVIFDETTTNLLKCSASAMVASQAQVFFCTPFNLSDTHTDLRLQDEDEHSGLPVALVNIVRTSQTLELKSHTEELEDFDADTQPKGNDVGCSSDTRKKR
ncbi:hypothetical protein Tco_1024976, partial [Tanacetum coccineum]